MRSSSNAFSCTSVLTRALGFLSVGFLAACAAPSSQKADPTAVATGLSQRGHPAVRTTAANPPREELPPGVSLASGLDEPAAVAIALWNNASFQENLSKLGVSRADLAQAGMLANPTLSMLFPAGPKQLEFTATLSLEALWLRPKRLAIAELDAERVANGLVQSGLELARDVKGALSDLGLATERATIAGQTLAIREEIAGLTAHRVRLGDASELDATAARAEMERARDEAGRLQHDQAILRERLSLLLGWTLGDVPVSLAPLPEGPPPLGAAELEAKALAARPDLRASELALESAGRKAGLADAEVFSLSGLLDANGSGKEGFEMGPGLVLPLPLLNQNNANRLRARAELERAGWNYLGVRQRIVAEVREARLKVVQASAALAAYEQRVLPPLEEMVRASRRAYELGEISPLAVHENARQLLLTQVRRAELRAELRRAWAELERSVGASRQTFLSPNPKSP